MIRLPNRLALLLPATLFAVLALVPRDRAASAAPLASELQFVPADAAFFLHADAAMLWNGEIVKSLRTADPKTSDELKAKTKSLFGTAPDAIKSVTLFWPKIKMEQDTAAFGIVLAFHAPFDKAKLKSGFDQLLPKGVKATLESPSETIAVLLAGLDPQKYGKPQPTDKPGPLTAAIRAAGSGQHLLVAGATLANFPDEIRGDNLPQEIRPFQSLLQAETITGIVDLGKELSVDIRVKAATPPRAKEAEKALGLLAELLTGALAGVLKDVSADAGRDPGLKDVATILTKLQAGVKEAKFSTDGEVARVIAKASTDLPFASAYVSAKVKVQEAAARAQSSNNLKQIVLATINYADSMGGSLPPGAVCDKTGKPLLSWRVLILPYIEQNALYKEFKLDESWDSDHNKKLIAKMPKVYAVPTATAAKANETHYRAFVGNGAAFDYIKGARFPADFPDGTSNTLLVVTAKDAVPWTKPDELDFDPDKDMTKLLGFFPGDRCIVGLADGSVRTLSKKISKVTLHGAITRGGGEVLGEDFE